MEHLKLYESYLSDMKDKQKEFELRFEIISKYVNFIDKYELPYLMLFQDSDNFSLMTISTHNKVGDYMLEYENLKTSKISIVDLKNLNNEIIKKLDEISVDVLDLNHILIGLYDANILISVIKNSDEKITFDTLMEVEEGVENLNTFEFQEMFFSKQPEALQVFMDVVNHDMNKRAEDKYKLKVDSKIKDRFPKEWEIYIQNKNMGKYKI